MKKFLLAVCLLSFFGAHGMEENALVPKDEIVPDEYLLFNVAKKGDTNKMSALLKNNVDRSFINVKYMGYMPLHLVRHKKEVDMLIENGANIEALDDAGCTPLYRSLARDYDEVAIALIDVGANVRALNSKGYTPLWLATLAHHEKVVKALLLASQGKVKPKTEKEVKSFHERIFTLLCMCSIPKVRENQKGENLPMLPQLPKDIQKNILLYLPEDIISAKMLAQLLPIADKECTREVITHCPRALLVQAAMILAEKNNEVKRNELVEEVIDYAQEQATAYCSIKYNGETLFEQTYDELGKLVDPADTAGVRAAFIREAIEKEFAKKNAEDSISSSSSSRGKQEEN